MHHPYTTWRKIVSYLWRVTFEEYLQQKKIDSGAFMREDATRWKEWQSEFESLSPASFTAQKLYLINPVRRQFPLKITPPQAAPPQAAAKPAKPAIPRPKFR